LAAVTGSPYDGITKLDQNNSGANLSVRTPDQISFQAFHQLTERWALMADATWTQQSRMQELRIKFENTTAPSITPERWKDAWRVALGAQYRASDALLLRGGVSYDKAPVDFQYRGPALPDSDRTWLALGANVRLSPPSHRRPGLRPRAAERRADERHRRCARRNPLQLQLRHRPWQLQELGHQPGPAVQLPVLSSWPAHPAGLDATC